MLRMWTSLFYSLISIYQPGLETIRILRLVGYSNLDLLPPFLVVFSHLRVPGYRAKFTLKMTLLSLFKMHNETINVWTHLIGFLIMLGITVNTSYKYWDSHWVDKTVRGVSFAILLFS